MPSSGDVAVAVDVVALTIRDGELCVLAVRRDRPPCQGRWSLPGATVGASEPLADAARRALAEAADVRPGRVEQLASYGAPGRDPRGRTVSVAWWTVLPPAATWRPVEPLLRRGRLAFDHRTILRDGVERVRGELERTGLATAFLPATFTVAELREVYEVVWGHPLDAGNFHRKVTRTEGFVVDTGERRSVGRGRPAAVYRAGPEQVLHPPLTRRSLHGG